MWLAEALDSLLGQTYRDFELVISDNASTDRTQSICADFAARDSRIRYIRHDINRGLIWNWNHVFERSNSQFFKWATYDDLYHPTFLQRCVEVLESNDDVVWCHTRSCHMNANRQLLSAEQNSMISYVVAGEGMPCRTSKNPSERFKAVILGHGGCLDSYGVIRSDVLRKTGMYLPYYGSEKVLMAELALWGRYHEVPEPLCFARVHEKAAGNMRTQVEQRKYINPFAAKWQFARLGLLRGYFHAVRRAEIPLHERLRCYATIGQYLIQVRKWKSVLLKGLTGSGLAAEYPMTNAQSITERPGLTSSSKSELCAN